MTISLDDFIKYFIKKWKIAAVMIIACVALFAGATKLLGEEISVPHSEEYLYYEKESAGLERYLENSVLMQMNPTDIPEITLYLEKSADPEALKDYMISKNIWTEFESERNKDYFYELLTWQEKEDGQAEVLLRHVTAEECLEAAEYLKQKCEEYDPEVQVTIGQLRAVKDEELQDEQLRWYDRIEYSKSLLLEAEAGYTIKVNVAAAVVTGAIAGGLLACVLVLLMYMAGRKKETDKDKKIG